MLKKILCFFIVLILAGCNADNYESHQVKVYIGGGPSINDCVFELTEKYTFSVKECIINNYDIRTSDFISEVMNEDVINFSGQREDIYDLINMLSVLPEDDEFKFVAEDVIYVIALVDNNVYWSVYNEDYTEYNNKALLNLVYKLIELSPITVGGEVNPILVPEQ